MRVSDPSGPGGGLAGPVLAFDTTGSLGSVAVARAEDGPSAAREFVRTFEPAPSHSANLLPAIREALEAARVASHELVLVVATRGPGSFTGLRIGLATLHGFRAASGTAAAGVSSLDAAALADLVASGSAGRRLTLVDALRGVVFAAIHDGPSGGPVAGPVRRSPQAAGRWGREHGVDRIAGPALARYGAVIAGEIPGAAIGDGRLPLAPAALRLGLGDARRGKSTLEPLYLRAPDIHAAGEGSATL